MVFQCCVLCTLVRPACRRVSVCLSCSKVSSGGRTGVNDEIHTHERVCPVPQLKIRHCTCTVRWSAWLYTWLFGFHFRLKCFLSLMTKSYVLHFTCVLWLGYTDTGLLSEFSRYWSQRLYFSQTLLDLWMIRDCYRNIFCPRHKKTPNVETYSHALSLLAYRHWVALDVPVKTSVNRIQS